MKDCVRTRPRINRRRRPGGVWGCRPGSTAIPPRAECGPTGRQSRSDPPRGCLLWSQPAVSQHLPGEKWRLITELTDVCVDKRVFAQERVGPVEVASVGDWLAFCHQDSIVSRTSLKRPSAKFTLRFTVVARVRPITRGGRATPPRSGSVAGRRRIGGQREKAES